MRSIFTLALACIGMSALAQAAPSYIAATSEGFIEGNSPAKLKSFTAWVQRNQITLQWTAAENLKASRFELERSADNRNWNALEIIGIREGIADYTTVDAAPLRGDNFYRLKVVELDGEAEHSNVLKANSYKRQTAHFGPNPATSQITITLTSSGGATVLVQLIDNKGLPVKEATYKTNQSNVLTFDLQGVAKGIYTLLIRNGEAFPETSQLIVQ